MEIWKNIKFLYFLDHRQFFIYTQVIIVVVANGFFLIREKYCEKTETSKVKIKFSKKRTGEEEEGKHAVNDAKWQETQLQHSSSSKN